MRQRTTAVVGLVGAGGALSQDPEQIQCDNERGPSPGDCDQARGSSAS